MQTASYPAASTIHSTARLASDARWFGSVPAPVAPGLPPVPRHPPGCACPRSGSNNPSAHQGWVEYPALFLREQARVSASPTSGVPGGCGSRREPRKLAKPALGRKPEQKRVVQVRPSNSRGVRPGSCRTPDGPETPSAIGFRRTPPVRLPPPVRSLLTVGLSPSLARSTIFFSSS